MAMSFRQVPAMGAWVPLLVAPGVLVALPHARAEGKNSFIW